MTINGTNYMGIRSYFIYRNDFRCQVLVGEVSFIIKSRVPVVKFETIKIHGSEVSD